MALRRALFGLCIVYVAGQIEMNQGQHHQQQQPIESIHVQNQLKQQQQQPIVNQVNLPPQVPVNTRTIEGDVAGRTNKLRDKNHVHDKEHIREHLQDIVSPEELGREMTDDEIEFYYFKLHDYDQNNRLDGLEIMKAMFHFDEKDLKTEDKMQEDEIIKLVADVFDEYDVNYDGYIDYPEYANAQHNE